MTFSITYCDEYERVIQSVLIDGKVSELQNGNAYRAYIDAYLDALQDTDMTYKIETKQGVLVGFFVYNTISEVVQQSFRRPFANYTILLQQEIGNFIASGNWVFSTLDGSNEDEITYTFSEYNLEDYLTQRYFFVWMDEVERVVQSVAIAAGDVTQYANGNIVRSDIDTLLQNISDYDIAYKIENQQGVLVGFFVYNIETDTTLTLIRNPYKQYDTEISASITQFIVSNVWEFDFLNQPFYNQRVSYNTTEYDPNDYLNQKYSFVPLDSTERVVQAVAIAASDVDSSNVARTDIDNLLQNVSNYDLAYKIENQQGVLVGFFAHNIEAVSTFTLIRNPFKQYDTQIASDITQFITSNVWESDFLNQPAYIQRIRYNTTEYNPNDYLVQMYSFVQLEFTERVVQAVLIDGKTNFLTLNANGNVIRAELDDFMLQLEGYRVTYKIENQQGVLVGFFGSDPCVDGYLVAVRRPFKSYLSAINQAVDTFVTSGVWRFNLLSIEPCPPTDLPCYFTINDCYMTINGCYATIDPNKKFVQRFF